MWMMLEALTGEGNTRRDGNIIPGIFDKIDKAVNAFGQGAVIVAVVAAPKEGAKIPVWEQF